MSTITFDTGQYTASATAGLLVAANNARTGVLIINTGTNPLYIGNSSVTSGTGAYLPGTAGASITIPTRDAIYVITASSTSVISYVESYI